MTRKRAMSDDQVLLARALYKPGVRGAGYKAIARQLGVGASTIRDLILFRTQYSAVPCNSATVQKSKRNV